MKKISIIVSIASALLLVLVSLPTIAKEQAIFNEEQENTEDAKWYPGFLIVQLMKGAIALVLILLILLDIIEP